MKVPLISVVICVRNSERFIKECIESILTEKTDHYEIIVVDDCSDDTSRDILEQLERQKKILYIFLPEKRGAAEARNRGVEASSGSILFFLDSDTRIVPGWSKAIKTLSSSGRLQKAIYLCKILRFTDSYKQFDSAGEYLSPWYLLIDRAGASLDVGQFNKSSEIFSGKSAAMIIPKDIFITLSGFDKRFEWLVEDTDICWRNWLLGNAVIYTPSIVVYHGYVTSGKGREYYTNLKPRYQGCKNTVLCILKNVEGKHILYAVFTQLCIWITLSAVLLSQGKWKDSIQIVQGLWWNIKNLSETLNARRYVQKTRTISDQELLLRVGQSRSLMYYVLKAILYAKQA